MSDNKSCTRREFLNRSSQAAAALCAATSLVSCAADNLKTAPLAARVIDANERVNLAVIGIRSRGKRLTEVFAKIPGVHIKTLCDIDENLFPAGVKLVNKIQGHDPQTEYDMRRVFDDKDIDAVVIATPNHWHALAAVWALQAGKHVYLEKPCSHEILEGRRVIEAAQKYNRIVQVGFQNRSNPKVRQGIQFLHQGGIGEVYMARVLCFKPRESIGRCPDGPAPPGEEYDYFIHGKTGPAYDSDYLSRVHYDLWLGPAPKRQFNHNRFHYNWHWFWDYGNGDIGNNAPHDLDIARWGLNKPCLPVKTFCSGGYFAFDSDQETPNTQIANYEFDDGTLMTCEVRGAYTNSEDEVLMGNLFYGSKGWMIINDGEWKSFFGRKNEPGPSSAGNEKETHSRMDLAGAGGAEHMENFIAALRTGRREDLHCDIEQGHLSCIIPHLANISYRLRRPVHFDSKSERFHEDQQANAMLLREYAKGFEMPKRV